MISRALIKEQMPVENLLASLQDIALLAIDDRLQLTYANPHALRLFGIAPSASSLPLSLHQPLLDALRMGEPAFAVQQSVAGQPHVFEAKISPFAGGHLLWLQDVTEHRKTEKRLSNKSALLNALISCNWLSNSSSSWRKNAPIDLEMIGKASGYCSVSILQNKAQGDGGSTAHCLFQWVNPETESSLVQPLVTLRYTADCCRRWHDTLASGQPLYGTTLSLPEQEQGLLQQHGISAIILIPISVEGAWWGIMAFTRSGPCSEIYTHEIDALSVAARSLEVGIEREISGNRLQQAATAFESMSEGVMITNADNRIVAINQGFTEITGYTEQDVLGQNPTMLQSAGHSPALYQAIWEGIGREGRWRGEILNRRKSGDIYPQWLTVTPIHDDNGEIVSYVSDIPHCCLP